MKRIFVIVTLIASFICAYGQDPDYTEIVMSKNDTRTRSIVDMPEASIIYEVLRISFDASGMYTLYIEDSSGVPVYTSTLPADGMEYSYDLSGIGEGMYRLVLDGPSGEYEGFFNLF